MKKRQIVSSILSLALLTMPITALADSQNTGLLLQNKGESQTSYIKENTESDLNIDVQTPSITNQNTDSMLSTDVPDTESFNTEQNPINMNIEDLPGTQNNANTYINNETESSNSGIKAEANFADFQKQMNSFLNANGFDYQEFSSQKFDLPDMSGIATEADLKEDYAAMISSFSNFGFGNQFTLPDNTGYTMNVIASFGDSFGSGLSTGFSEYTLTKQDMSPLELYNQVDTTRKALFGDYENNEVYNNVTKNLEIGATLAKIDEYKIEPGDIDLNQKSFGDLENKIENDFSYNFNLHTTKNAYNSNKVLNGKSKFNENKSEVSSIKDEIDNQSNNWFTIKHNDSNGNFAWTQDLRKATLKGLEDYMKDKKEDAIASSDTMNKAKEKADDLSERVQKKDRSFEDLFNEMLTMTSPDSRNN